ncbi:MAG: hypothetical protein OH319_02670 [Candidatus Parvarchaeota archaeon]|nr:hypothetical protein [Candidatus Jingweiarchaeum tengchongense]MCW1298272.1 hypothetical protein [Candidatus Jingweiarchaeum tengchongense]MCW1300363.1 hypothetical protein [Candidatus Jingweiarchaeum tengchongense]MCW1304792.1 hypothetical protein [Candidatus Jingweiarchaeum tengchongense]MCW1305382.1 hypothetical protein [Candidatus Jingweiarchaeum tengchongense]
MNKKINENIEDMIVNRLREVYGENLRSVYNLSSTASPKEGIVKGLRDIDVTVFLDKIEPEGGTRILEDIKFLGEKLGISFDYWSYPVCYLERGEECIRENWMRPKRREGMDLVGKVVTRRTQKCGSLIYGEDVLKNVKINLDERDACAWSRNSFRMLFEKLQKYMVNNTETNKNSLIYQLAKTELQTMGQAWEMLALGDYLDYPEIEERTIYDKVAKKIKLKIDPANEETLKKYGITLESFLKKTIGRTGEEEKSSSGVVLAWHSYFLPDFLRRRGIKISEFEKLGPEIIRTGIAGFTTGNFDDFNAIMNKYWIESIKHNVKLMKELCNIKSLSAANH